MSKTKYQDSNFAEPEKSNDFLSDTLLFTQKNRKLNTFVGVFVIIMTIIGTISTIKFTVDTTIKLTDKTSVKNELTGFIYPAVVVDIPAFENAAQLPKETVISTAIWNIMLSDDTEKYPVEGDYMFVPSIDIDASIASLFGTEIKVTHKTVGDFELSFTYDEETKNYTIPVSPSYLPYYPYVYSFNKTGSTYTVKVGYMTPGKYFLSKNEKNLPKPIKYMEYIIEKHGSDMRILSLHTYEPEQTTTKE